MIGFKFKLDNCIVKIENDLVINLYIILFNFISYMYVKMKFCLLILSENFL